MPTLLKEIMMLLAHFAPLFSARTWSDVPPRITGWA